MKLINTELRASRLLATSAACGLLALSSSVLAQGIPVQIPLSDFCQVQPGSFCTNDVIGTRTLTELAPTVITPLNGGITQVTGSSRIDFDGRLQVDGSALQNSAIFPSLLLSPLNDQLNVQAAGQYDVTFDVNLQPSGVLTANPGTTFTSNSLTVKSIGVDLNNGSVTFADGAVGKLRLTSDDAANIVENGTAVHGTFSTTDGKVVIGTLSGTASVVSAPGVTTLLDGSGNPLDFTSPYALTLDITSTILTQLDGEGLITPKVAVTGGIEMNDSRITGLADGVNAHDAVNLGQLQSENAARVAADAALSNRLNAVDSRVDLLAGRIDKLDRKIASSTAVAVAMGGATFLPGMKFNLTANVATYDGAHAGAFQVGALVNSHVALNGGVATGFNRGGKTAGRVGVTFGW